MQGHGRIIAHNFCVAHREANSGLSTLNHTKSILSIYHQQRQLQKQRGMCLNDTYPFCQQPLSSNCHSICFSKPVLWAATPGWRFSPLIRIVTVYPKICSVIVIGISTTSSRRCDQPPAVRAAPCYYRIISSDKLQHLFHPTRGERSNAAPARCLPLCHRHTRLTVVRRG